MKTFEAFLEKFQEIPRFPTEGLMSIIFSGILFINVLAIIAAGGNKEGNNA